jgi:hypothetical protein
MTHIAELRYGELVITSHLLYVNIAMWDCCLICYACVVLKGLLLLGWSSLSLWASRYRTLWLSQHDAPTRLRFGRHNAPTLVLRLKGTGHLERHVGGFVIDLQVLLVVALRVLVLPLEGVKYLGSRIMLRWGVLLLFKSLWDCHRLLERLLYDLWALHSL